MRVFRVKKLSAFFLLVTAMTVYPGSIWAELIYDAGKSQNTDPETVSEDSSENNDQVLYSRKSHPIAPRNQVVRIQIEGISKDLLASAQSRQDVCARNDEFKKMVQEIESAGNYIWVRSADLSVIEDSSEIKNIDRKAWLDSQNVVTKTRDALICKIVYFNQEEYDRSFLKTVETFLDGRKILLQDGLVVTLPKLSRTHLDSVDNELAHRAQSSMSGVFPYYKIDQTVEGSSSRSIRDDGRYQFRDEGSDGKTFNGRAQISYLRNDLQEIFGVDRKTFRFEKSDSAEDEFGINVPYIDLVFYLRENLSDTQQVVDLKWRGRFVVRVYERPVDFSADGRASHFYVFRKILQVKRWKVLHPPGIFGPAYHFKGWTDDLKLLRAFYGTMNNDWGKDVERRTLPDHEEVFVREEIYKIAPDENDPENQEFSPAPGYEHLLERQPKAVLKIK